MNLKCLSYQALFRFKQTKLAGKLFFKGGEPFKVLRKGVIARGTVTHIESAQADGDWTFNILADMATTKDLAPQLHCEITPCTSGSLQTFKASVKVGCFVEVYGDLCFDPPHLGEDGGGYEIHPVTAAAIIREA